MATDGNNTSARGRRAGEAPVQVTVQTGFFLKRNTEADPDEACQGEGEFKQDCIECGIGKSDNTIALYLEAFDNQMKPEGQREEVEAIWTRRRSHTSCPTLDDPTFPPLCYFKKIFSEGYYNLYTRGDNDVLLLQGKEIRRFRSLYRTFRRLAQTHKEETGDWPTVSKLQTLFQEHAPESHAKNIACLQCLLPSQRKVFDQLFHQNEAITKQLDIVLAAQASLQAGQDILLQKLDSLQEDVDEFKTRRHHD